MEDTLKPEKIKSTGTEEPSPPPISSQTEAAAYCATVISNVGGRRQQWLSRTREGRRVTIEQLNLRLRRQEDLCGITPPPPMDTPSWDSLTWRAARLHRMMPPGPSPQQNQLISTPTPPIEPTMALLRATLSALGVGEPMRNYLWEGLFENENGGQKGVEEDEEELLQTAAQFLTNFAGRRGFKVLCSFKLPDICKLALDLSLQEEAGSNSRPPCVFPMPRPPLPRPPMMRPPPGQDYGATPWPPYHAQNMRNNNNCCGCLCHGGRNNHVVPPIVPKPGVLRWMTRKYDQEKEQDRSRRNGVRAKIAAAFGKLAFWRRGRQDDDSDSDTSSISTRTLSTCT